jgi:hypothetical protein
LDGEDFYIDLLFYHLKLRCYVIVDLKTTGFKPEYTGKVNFYLSAVDSLLRHPDDKTVSWADSLQDPQQDCRRIRIAQCQEPHEHCALHDQNGRRRLALLLQASFAV